MAQERVSWLRRCLNYLKEVSSRYNTTETKVTEETDGKDGFLFKVTKKRCAHCGCEDPEVESNILTEEETCAYLSSDTAQEHMPLTAP